MNQAEMQPNEKSAASGRRPYSTPRIEEYGRLAEITRTAQHATTTNDGGTGSLNYSC